MCAGEGRKVGKAGGLIVFISSMALSKSLNLSGTQFPYLQNGKITLLLGIGKNQVNQSGIVPGI